MARRVSVTNLNARTIDILNTIRANASYEYQNMVPNITSEKDIPKVGEILYGYPAIANQFVNALVNRIALVKINSAVFNNAYAELKKGYLEFGETVEEVFVSITKAREFSYDKAEARELKRSLPDVKTAFHSMNWRVQYPVTIQNDELKTAFLSIDGVQDLIARIVDAVYTAAEYDEYLLFKYLIIKAVSHGKMYPVEFDTSDIKNAAVAFRGTSNQLTFLSDMYNATGVHTTTPKSDQYIFMDSAFNAKYDVNVLAGAFNMDKADFIGKLKLIDSFTTFDNERFSEIRANCDMIENVTAQELALMANVKAVLVDKEWFQIYDNLTQFTEKYVASGLYWNYFYNVWKTVSSSPFSNAVVFVSSTATTDLPATIDVEITGIENSEAGIIYTIVPDDDNPALSPSTLKFTQTEDNVKALIAVHPYGAYIVPGTTEEFTPVATMGGATYTGTAITVATAAVGDTITLTKG